MCDLVDALTHQDSEDYTTFIRRVCGVPSAKPIKEADIKDNYERLHLVTRHVEPVKLEPTAVRLKS